MNQVSTHGCHELLTFPRIFICQINDKTWLGLKVQKHAQKCLVILVGNRHRYSYKFELNKLDDLKQLMTKPVLMLVLVILNNT